MSALNPRKTALEILCDIETEGAYSNLSIQEELESKAFETADRRMLTRLVYGVLENRMLLDHIIRNHSKTTPEKMKPWVLNSLRLAVYQMGWMDRVPDSAAINESVKLVKKRYGALGNFVNGVLRAIQRSGIDTAPILGDDVKGLALRYSHPEWLVARWLEQLGLERTVSILEADNRPAELSVRLNRLKISKDEALVKLKGIGVTARPSEYLEEALILEDLGPNRLVELPLYRHGAMTVQDVSSMLVARAVSPEPGQRVLDLCAAPGGKTTHMAERMDDTGVITACDIHPHKLELILQNAQRLGLKSISVEEQDGTVLREAWVEQYDHVLVDAPCSGLGIIRRKPEIRYTKTPEDSGFLAVLQGQLLDTACRYVKKHGQLIYSTCTIEVEENERVVRSFMERHPEFRPVDIGQRIPAQLKTEGPFLTLLPDLSGLDGFFIAVLTKTSEVE